MTVKRQATEDPEHEAKRIKEETLTDFFFTRAKSFEKIADIISNNHDILLGLCPFFDLESEYLRFVSNGPHGGSNFLFNIKDSLYTVGNLLEAVDELISFAYDSIWFDLE